MSARPRGPIDPSTLPKRYPFPQVLADVLRRLRQHKDEDTLPRGGRGIFYDLRPNGFDPDAGLTYRKRRPDENGNNLVKHGIVTPEYVTDRVLLLARRAELVPERWISDSRAPDPLNPRSEWNDARDLAFTVAWQLERAKLARQAEQPVFLVIWSEAEDLQPRIARVAGDMGVSVWSGGGSDGLKVKRRLAEEAARRKVPTVVGHIGDFDLYGERIFTALEEDCDGWFAHDHWQADSANLTFERLALTEAQAREFDLLDADGKAEADGIPVPRLDAIIRDFADRHHDVAVRDARIAGDAELRAEATRLLTERFAS